MEVHHHRSTRWTMLLGALLAGSASLVFALAPARGDTVQPLITIGSAAVRNGVATVTATVDPANVAAVTINGQPVAVKAGGAIQASVAPNGRASLQIGSSNRKTGELATLSIPLKAGIIGPNGEIDANVLVPLQQAGITVLRPADGFAVLDGRPLAIGLRVLDSSQLASLTVNGADALVQLGQDGAATAPASGSSNEIVVTATDKQGVTQANSYPVKQVSSLIRTAAGSSVSALGAQGLRISKIRYITTGVRSSRQIRAVVTVKDLRGYLVRDAIVQFGSMEAGRAKGGTQVKLSSKTGTATFAMRLLPKAFGQRFYTVTRAKTPWAKVRKVSSVSLPLLKARIR